MRVAVEAQVVGVVMTFREWLDLDAEERVAWATARRILLGNARDNARDLEIREKERIEDLAMRQLDRSRDDANADELGAPSVMTGLVQARSQAGG